MAILDLPYVSHLELLLEFKGIFLGVLPFSCHYYFATSHPSETLRSLIVVSAVHSTICMAFLRQILNPATSAKPVMTKLQTLLI